MLEDVQSTAAKFGEEPNKQKQAFADKLMQTPTNSKTASAAKSIASYGNRTHVKSLDGFYTTTTPTMLEDVNFRTATFL